VSIASLALFAIGACGKKGPPLAPLRLVPAPVEDFSIRRIGSEVFLDFNVPTENSDGSTPADIGSVELYALTAHSFPSTEPPLTDREFRRAATLIATFEMHQPPEPEDLEDDEADQESTADTLSVASLTVIEDAGYVQGQRISFIETLTPQMLTPIDLTEIRRSPRRRSNEQDKKQLRLQELQGPLVSPSFVPPPSRFYAAIGVTKGGRRSPAAPIPMRLTAPPHSTAYPSVQYTSDVVTMTWIPAREARRLVQVPVSESFLRSAPIEEFGQPSRLRITSRYNVYEVAKNTNVTDVAPIPLNDTPLESLQFQDPRVEFGLERCYMIGTLKQINQMVLDSTESVDATEPVETFEMMVESLPSTETCVKFIDTFPPAPPTNLVAVANVGTINLIWNASSEADLAGYQVLRAEATGERLQPLHSDIITETTYRDTSAIAGVDYVYAVVALDTAKAPNISGPSNQVQETPR
jgi:hypothetical protein